MAKKKVDAAVENAEVPTKAPGVQEVTVSWRGKSRVFSVAVHGINFEQCARDFAAKFNGTIA